MTRTLDWDVDGADWPLRESSRFVRAAGLRWHVQRCGQGPVLLLLHGTGAATHSWRDLAPLLAREFTVIAPDLPGHGFTSPMPDGRPTLRAVADAVGALLAELDVQPDMVVGHSAGAAIMLRLALDRTVRARAYVGLNGALRPFGGLLASLVFQPMARLLAGSPWVPRWFSGQARDPQAAGRLLASTGSTIDARGLALYARLLRSPAHVAGALAMMAHWDLRTLESETAAARLPLWLLAGRLDATVPVQQAVQFGAAVGARVTLLEGLGHLAHEEQPERVARLLLDMAHEAGVLRNATSHVAAAVRPTGVLTTPPAHAAAARR
jgi:magnesium chelatase accessory protein